MRNVKYLLPSKEIDMGGIGVLQPFPTHKVDQIDPFLLLHHAEWKLPKGYIPLKTGVGPHPHRGFSPISFIFKGGIHHRDTMGNSSVIMEGGTQWLNAGRGMMHSERPPENMDQPEQQFVQLWINTPANHKMDAPKYFALSEKETPQIPNTENDIRLVSGEYQGVKGPIEYFSRLIILRMQLKAASEESFSIPASMNALLYLVSGEINLKKYGKVEAQNAVVFDNSDEEINFSINKDSKALLLAGEPLNEPVVRQGPYVMNSETQIMEAMRDFNMNKFGFLVEE